MCDSMIATREVTRDGYAIYGKNSDRSCNEPQYFTCIPAKDHEKGARVRCTYIEAEQAPHTNALILSKPSWIWGAEMGVNEHGLVIGNEAVYSKETKTEPALLGMDILRMALERAATAREAVDVMTGLLGRYGQGGNASFDGSFLYDNSFFAVDAHETWYLETAGDYWAARQIQGAYTISNHMILGRPDRMHPGALAHARQAGYPVTDPFDFTEAYIDWDRPHNVSGIVRRASSQRLLDTFGRRVTREDMWRVMCSHTTANPWLAGGRSVCKHAVSKEWDSTTTCSLLAVLKPGETTLWGTGMSTPCLALLQPFWMDAFSPDFVFDYGEQEAAMNRWIRYEGINRAMVDGRLPEAAYRAERDALQALFFRMADEAAPKDRQELCRDISQKTAAFLDKWLAAAEKLPSKPLGDADFAAFWAAKNEALGKDRRIAR